MSSQTLVFSLVAVLAIGSASLIPAYADSIPQPDLSKDKAIGSTTYVTFQSDYRYTVITETQYQVEGPLQVPEVITYPSIDGTQIFTIPLKELFIKANTPVVAGEEAELTQSELDKIAQQKRHEDLRQEIEAEKLKFYPEVKTCLEEFQKNNPIGYEGWLRTANMDDWTIPTNVPQANNLNYYEKDAKKKHQACLHMTNYTDIHIWEANKVQDRPQLQSLDESDSPLTVPVTEADILAEAQRAEEQKRHYINPYKDFEGENRGNPDVHLEDKSQFCQTTAWEIDASGQLCPMNALIQHYEQQVEKTPQQIHEELQELLCDEYQHQYTAVRHPDWLSHCVFDEDEGN
jgi:hypothetical protein